MFLQRKKGKVKHKPPLVSGGFLFITFFLTISLISPAISHAKDEKVSFSPTPSTEGSYQKLDKSSVPVQETSDASIPKSAKFKTKKPFGKDKSLSLQKIPGKNLKTLTTADQPPPKFDEKGRVNLTALARPTAQTLRDSALNLKPQDFSTAQLLGWPTKPLTHPESLDNVIKATPNEIESLTRPKKEDVVNKVQLVGVQQESTPRLFVTPEYLTFFARVGANPQSQMIKIKNKGVGTLNYSLSESVTWATLDSSGGSVTTAENIVTISIDTSGLSEAGSPYKGEIVVSNNEDGTDREYITLKLYVTSAYGIVSTYSYDPNGNLARRIDADGNVIEYEYDNANRLVKILYPDGDTVLYEYDMNGNKTKITDKTGVTEYIYDQFNRLYAAIFLEVAAIVYQYDNNGNVKKIVYPDSREVNYTYDGDNRLTQVSYTLDSTTYTTTYGYDPQTGNLASKTLPNGVVTTYLYDTADRLTDCINKKSDATLISSYRYTLDANGNRRSVLETTPEGSKTTNYEYDQLNRLTRTTYPDGTDVYYEYDTAGNRLAEITNGVRRNYQYDKDNRLIQAGDEIFLYDKRGNLKKRVSPTKTQEYTYDYENRLIRYADGVRVVEYEYNGDGIRISKTVDGDKTIFINDVRTPLTQVLMETTGNWYIKKRYVYGRDLISQEE